MILTIMTYLGIACAILGNILVIKKNIIAYPCWLFGNALILPAYLISGDIPYIILYLVYAGLNVYGWITWNKIAKIGDLKT